MAWATERQDFVVPQSIAGAAELCHALSWTEAYAGVLFKFDDAVQALDDGIAELASAGTLWQENAMPLTNGAFCAPFGTGDTEILNDIQDQMHASSPVLAKEWHDNTGVYVGPAGCRWLTYLVKGAYMLPRRCAIGTKVCHDYSLKGQRGFWDNSIKASQPSTEGVQALHFCVEHRRCGLDIRHHVSGSGRCVRPELLGRPISAVPERVACSFAGAVFLQMPNTLLTGRFVRAELVIANLEALRPGVAAALNTAVNLAGTIMFAVVPHQIISQLAKDPADPARHSTAVQGVSFFQTGR